MEQLTQSIDVITLCGADGTVRPLRLRLGNGEQSMRVDILRVVHTKEVSRPGSEGQIFDCFGRVGLLECRVEIKYCLRSHVWLLLRESVWGFRFRHSGV